MIPEGVTAHSPQLLIKLLAQPPGNHGQYLKEEAVSAYRFLVEHKFLTQIESKSKKASGKRVTITTKLDHKVETAANELRLYLEDQLQQV